MQCRLAIFLSISQDDTKYPNREHAYFIIPSMLTKMQCNSSARIRRQPSLFTLDMSVCLVWKCIGKCQQFAAGVTELISLHIDECTTSTSNCQEICTNTIGIFVGSNDPYFSINVTHSSLCDGWNCLVQSSLSMCKRDSSYLCVFTLVQLSACMAN